MMKSPAVSLILFLALVQAQNVARLKADSREFFLFTFLREQLVRSNKPRQTLRPHIENGVTFSRSFTQLPKNSNFYLQFNDNHCASSDAYGNNACHFNWGETMMGNYSISLPISIDVGDSMTGHFMVRNISLLFTMVNLLTFQMAWCFAHISLILIFLLSFIRSTALFPMNLLANSVVYPVYSQSQSSIPTTLFPCLTAPYPDT